MHDLTDTDLLHRWIAGDREAFAVLVVRHHAFVTAACRRQIPGGDADDSVQAVFLLLMRKPRAAARAPVLAAWLQRVAFFVCRTAKRGVERRKHTEKIVAQEQLREPTPPHQALEHLDECLMKLPERQRAAINLHYLAGKTPDEVAVTLGITRDHAYQLICRGLSALRTRLAHRGFPVSAAVLVSLFAAEAHAATATLPTEMAFTPPFMATPRAASLATGALRTMTITSLTPLAAAAGLLLTVGLLTVTFTAEPSPAPSAVPAATPAPVVMALSPLEKALKTPVSCAFADAPLQDVAAWLGTVSTAVVLDPQALVSDQRLSFTVDHMPLKDAVLLIERMSGLKPVIEGDRRMVLHLPPTQTKAGKAMRQIILTAIAYDNEHDNHWPIDLVELKKWSKGELKDQLFQCLEHPEIEQPLLYVRPCSTPTATQPVILQDPACNDGQGSLVCYADGHVSYEKDAVATAMWEEAKRLAASPKAKSGGIETRDWTTPPDIKALR